MVIWENILMLAAVCINIPISMYFCQQSSSTLLEVTATDVAMVQAWIIAIDNQLLC